MPAARIGPIIDAAVARFEQFQALKRELDQVEEKLADRKVVERAKGILMNGRHLSEEEAFRAMRKQAMESNATRGGITERDRSRAHARRRATSGCG